MAHINHEYYSVSQINVPHYLE